MSWYPFLEGLAAGVWLAACVYAIVDRLARRRPPGAGALDRAYRDAASPPGDPVERLRAPGRSW